VETYDIYLGKKGKLTIYLGREGETYDIYLGRKGKLTIYI